MWNGESTNLSELFLCVPKSCDALDLQPENKTVCFGSTIRYLISIHRSELFNNRSGVHLPLAEYIHRGYCELKITKDYMQTAVNAFAIFLHGTLDDIERLPADYVLRSVSMEKN